MDKKEFELEKLMQLKTIATSYNGYNFAAIERSVLIWSEQVKDIKKHEEFE